MVGKLNIKFYTNFRRLIPSYIDLHPDDSWGTIFGAVVTFHRSSRNHAKGTQKATEQHGLRYEGLVSCPTRTCGATSKNHLLTFLLMTHIVTRLPKKSTSSNQASVVVAAIAVVVVAVVVVVVLRPWPSSSPSPGRRGPRRPPRSTA